MASFRIYDLTRVVCPASGTRYWTARVVAGKASLPVDTRWGSWQGDALGRRYDLPSYVSRTLQDKVRPLERREQKALEA